jgi:hypothetical protein
MVGLVAFGRVNNLEKNWMSMSGEVDGSDNGLRAIASMCEPVEIWTIP